MTYAEAMLEMALGKVVFSGRFEYRMRGGGVIERLNGWWQPLQWNLDAEELASHEWVVGEPELKRPEVKAPGPRSFNRKE